MMKDHEGAGETVRVCMVLLTAAMIGLLYAKRRALNITLRVFAVLLALSAAGFTVRAGHLGATLVWKDEEELTESTR